MWNSISIYICVNKNKAEYRGKKIFVVNEKPALFLEILTSLEDKSELGETFFAGERKGEGLVDYG